MFATSASKPIFNYITLVEPFTPAVWLGITAALIAVSFILSFIAKIEQQFKAESLEVQYTPLKTFWYVYGTFFEMTITHPIIPRQFTSLRYLRLLIEEYAVPMIYFFRVAVMTWLLAGMILSASYGGSLKAFLTKPMYSKTITTYEELVNAGLPWDMVLYGEEIEVFLEQTNDEVLSKLWKEKIIAEYDQYLTERVSEISTLSFKN